MKARFVAILMMSCVCSTVTAFAQSFQQMQQQQLQAVTAEAGLAKKCAAELSVYAGAFDNGSVENQLREFEAAFVAALRQRGEGSDLTDVIQAHPLPKYESFAPSVWVDLSASAVSESCINYFYKGSQWLKFERLARLVIRMNTFNTIKKDYEFRKQFLSPDDPNNPFVQHPSGDRNGTQVMEHPFPGEHGRDHFIDGPPTTSPTAGRGPASAEERGRIGEAIMTSSVNPVGPAMKVIQDTKKEEQEIIDEAEHSIEGAAGGGGGNAGNGGAGGTSSPGHGVDPKREPHDKDPKDSTHDH